MQSPRAGFRKSLADEVRGASAAALALLSDSLGIDPAPHDDDRTAVAVCTLSYWLLAGVGERDRTPVCFCCDFFLLRFFLRRFLRRKRGPPPGSADVAAIVNRLHQIV